MTGILRVARGQYSRFQFATVLVRSFWGARHCTVEISDLRRNLKAFYSPRFKARAGKLGETATGKLRPVSKLCLS